MNILEKLTTLEKEAADFGFKWENTAQIMAQIASECAEINIHLQTPESARNKTELQEEIGDLLHAVFSLCVFCQFDPKETLDKSVSKFARRLKAVQDLASEQGLTTLKGHTFEELMAFWDKAKQTVG